jgi:hypothetical protein
MQFSGSLRVFRMRALTRSPRPPSATALMRNQFINTIMILTIEILSIGRYKRFLLPSRLERGLHSSVENG